MMSNKTDILIVAGRFFCEQGYHGATMREIARAVNLKSASLYTHISSKQELLWEIVDRMADRFLAHAQALPQDLPPHRQLEALVHGHIKIIMRERHNVGVFFYEWRFLEARLRGEIQEKRDTYEACFQSVIDEGIRQGIFQVNDTRMATLFVLSALNWTTQWLRPGGRFSAEQLANAYFELFMRLLTEERK